MAPTAGMSIGPAPNAAGIPPRCVCYRPMGREGHDRSWVWDRFRGRTPATERWMMRRCVLGTSFVSSFTQVVEQTGKEGDVAHDAK